MRLTRLTAAIATALLLQGCFTGIESTPKVTDKEVRNQKATESAEALFARRIMPCGPMEWEPGRRFVATDSKLSMLMETEPCISPSDTLVYQGFSQEINIMGDSVTVMRFSGAADGRGFRYRIDSPPSKLRGVNGFKIPFTVDLDMVSEARRLLVGNSYYLLTPLRADSLARQIANGRKFIPVTITDVSAGTDYYPLLVSFVDDCGDHGRVVMTGGADASSTRNFDALFSFTDPRAKHASISDAVWANIVNGSIAAGMTPDECRLAIGAPRDIRKSQNGGTYFEQWTFDNGTYLIFEDGALTTYRL